MIWKKLILILSWLLMSYLILNEEVDKSDITLYSIIWILKIVKIIFIYEFREESLEFRE